MKLNWGSGIAIFLTLFIGFILTLVVKAHQTESDLYAEDYYAQEVNYQQTIDSKSRGKLYNEQFTVSKNERGDVLISYPNWMHDKNKTRITFYRPDDAKLDRMFSFSKKGNKLVLKHSHFVKGHYDIRIEWRSNLDDFLVEKEIDL